MNKRPQAKPAHNRVVKWNTQTSAARWNAQVLLQIQNKLAENPEANLGTLIPPGI
jgi:hypothetical protein